MMKKEMNYGDYWERAKSSSWQIKYQCFEVDAGDSLRAVSFACFFLRG